MYKKKISSVVVLIPSYNELDSLKINIFKIIKFFNVLIVDDGSTDKTQLFLKNNRIPFIKNKKNKGYEKSLGIGLKKLINIKNIKYIITMDADGQHRVEDAIKIFNLCIKAKADLVIGSRKKKNRITEMILSKLFYLKYKIKDPISGLKIYNVEKLKKINFQGKNLYFVNLVLDFLKKKFKTLSTEIKFNKRFDKPRVGGSFTVNLKIIKIILYCMVR